MANDIYRIDLLAPGTTTITVTDDGTGIDWLELVGSYADATDIRLNWFGDFPTSTAASGLFFTAGAAGHRLIVNGVIENVLGSDSADFIQGNEANNQLYGDHDNGLGGNDTLNGADGNDSIYGGNGDDSLIGDIGNDLILGDAGNDTISGSGGKDTIEGGTGADVLSGGAEAGDTVSYAGSEAGVRVDIKHGAIRLGVGGDAAGDQISGFLNIIGSRHNDTLTDADSATIAFGYNDNAFYGGRGADRLTMGGGNDTAVGGSGNDSLSGGAGRDRLTGGAGADEISGGGGADRFMFLTAADSTVTAAGRDTLIDFRHAQGDHIDMSALADFTFRTKAQGFSGNGPEVTYVTVAGGVKVMGDIDGDSQADFAIVVQGVASLVAADFIL